MNIYCKPLCLELLIYSPDTLSLLGSLVWVAHVEDSAGVVLVSVVAVGKAGTAEGGLNVAEQGAGSGGKTKRLEHTSGEVVTASDELSSNAGTEASRATKAS